jgi:hypothetical protein
MANASDFYQIEWKNHLSSTKSEDCGFESRVGLLLFSAFKTLFDIFYAKHSIQDIKITISPAFGDLKWSCE